MWLDSGSDIRSLILPPSFECTAFADACADAMSVGMGGFVRLPDQRQLFFQVTFTKPQMLRLFSWLPSDCSLQSYIATWELAAQAALLLLLHRLLGEGHLPCHTIFRSDNSAAESASWEGTAAQRISVHVVHIPHVSNEVADGLSRGSDPADFGFRPADCVEIDWSSISSVSPMRFYPSFEPFRGFSSLFDVRWDAVLDGLFGAVPSVRLDHLWSDRRQKDRRSFSVRPRSVSPDVRTSG
ncbi:unnamed protein product [Symbiodinium sp. CCMP2592]|nr:unnamed protein product [Symbiodinium sp. CCMP2592]